MSDLLPVALFKGTITSEVLATYAEKAAGLSGLYMDLEDPEQRKHVKEKAKEIKEIIDTLDKERKLKKANFNTALQKEFDAIVGSLAKSNSAYTLLLDEYNAKRKAQLAEEKRLLKEEQDAQQKLLDHEQAINDNEFFDLKKREQVILAKEAAQKAKDDAIEEGKRLAQQAIEDAENAKKRAEQQAAQAIKDAEDAKIRAEKQAAQLAIDNEAKRLADIEETKRQEKLAAEAKIREERANEEKRKNDNEIFVRVMGTAKRAFMAKGLSEEDATTACLAIKDGFIPGVSISFL